MACLTAQLPPASKTTPPLGRYTGKQKSRGLSFRYVGVFDLRAKGAYTLSYDKKTLKGRGRYAVVKGVVRFTGGPYSGMVADYTMEADGVPTLDGRMKVGDTEVRVVLRHDAYSDLADRRGAGPSASEEG